MSAAYVLFCAYTPITIVGGSNLDDALFMDHAQMLLEGRWLGPFSQFTLMKGPGYSVFLAVSALSGLPISVSEAIFNLIAVGALAWVIWRLSDSPFAAIAIFVVTLWNPGLVSLRVLRQAIYSAQTLLFLAVFSFALFGINRIARVVMMGALAGIILGWFWLTREEGFWMLPGIAILIFGAGLRSWIQSRTIRVPAIATGCMLLAFALVLVAFRTVNLFVYGSFVGVDTQETNFIGAVDTLQSVEVGKLIPYVPVSAEARAKIYQVSPAFASLREYLDPPEGSPFEVPGCRSYPWTCHEIAGGWFIWALRDAAASAGYYETPARAAEFFRQIRIEVGSACADHRLVCDPVPIPFMPRMSRAQAWTIPGSIRRVIGNLEFRRPPLLVQGPSSGTAQQLSEYWHFLNEPIPMPVAQRASADARLTADELLELRAESPLIPLALGVRSFLNYAYSFVLPAILWPGLISILIAVWMSGPRRAASEPIIILIILAATAWGLLLTRVLLIALIDASSFPAASWEYAAPAFPLSCIAPLLSIASLMKQLRFRSSAAKSDAEESVAAISAR